MTDRVRLAIVALLAALLVVACMTRSPAPVSERSPLSQPPALPPPSTCGCAARTEPAPPPTYTVKRGDTLAQIALDNGLDYRELAAWNNIDNPNVIRVGQVLVLAAPGAAAPAGTAVTTPLAAAPPIAPRIRSATAQAAPVLPSGRTNTATFKAEPKALKLPYSDQALAQLQSSNVVAPAVVAPAAPAVVAPSALVAVLAAVAPSAAGPGTVAALPARLDSSRVPEIDGGKVEWAWPT